MASTTDRTYSQPRRESGPDETESNSENRYHYHSVRDSLEHLRNISPTVCCVWLQPTWVQPTRIAHTSSSETITRTPPLSTLEVCIYVYSMICMLPTMSL